MKREVRYKEPTSYFPKELQKYFDVQEDTPKKTVKKTTRKTTKKTAKKK